MYDIFYLNLCSLRCFKYIIGMGLFNHFIKIVSRNCCAARCPVFEIYRPPWNIFQLFINIIQSGEEKEESSSAFFSIPKICPRRAVFSANCEV